MNILHKAGDLVSQLFGNNKLYRSMFEYRIYSGQVNVIADNPDSYLKDGYTGNADVFSIVNKIDIMSRQARLRLMIKPTNSKEEATEVDNHELLRFTKKVNPDNTFDLFRSGFLIYRLVLGNVFIYAPKISAGINKGKAIEVWLMPANDVEIIEGSMFEPIKGYKIEGNDRVMFERFEVVHSKMFNPLFNTDKSLYGLSPLKAAARIVSKQNQAELSELKSFENGGAPYIMYRDSTGNVMDRMTDTQRTEIEDQVRNAAKSDRKGLPLILKDKFGIIKLGDTLVDLNIIQSSREGRRVLCNIWGFPSDLMNDPESATYNNKREARKAAWTDCIMPNMNEFASVLTEATISGTEYENQGYFWSFDYSEVEELAEGMETKVNWAVRAGWSKNEIRRMTGQPSHPDPIMDEPIFGQGEVPLSDMTVKLDEELKDYSDYATQTR